MLENQKIYCCEQCNTNFIAYIHEKRRFCSRSCVAIYGNSIRIKSDKKINNKNCLHCNISLSDKSIYNKFCSMTCSATYNNKNKDLKTIEKQKQTFIINKKLNKHKKPYKISYTPISFCKSCSKVFEGRKLSCSETCRRKLLSNGGKKSASTIIKRSKDEIKLYNLIKSYISNVEHNYIIKDGWDADIVLPDQKIAILWNGPWHYKQMPHNNHSLEQVKNRDKIKIDLFTKNKWKVLVFEDRYYTPESAFLKIKIIAQGRN